MLELISHLEKLLKLAQSRDENDLGPTMIQDIDGAVGRLVEINRNGDCTGTTDGKIGGVPFRAIRCEQTDTITGFYAKFDERVSQARDAAEKLLGRNGFPAVGVAEHLRPRSGVLIYGVKKTGGQRRVAHANFECTLEGKMVQRRVMRLFRAQRFRQRVYMREADWVAQEAAILRTWGAAMLRPCGGTIHR